MSRHLIYSIQANVDFRCRDIYAQGNAIRAIRAIRAVRAPLPAQLTSMQSPSRLDVSKALVIYCLVGDFALTFCTGSELRLSAAYSTPPCL